MFDFAKNRQGKKIFVLVDYPEIMDPVPFAWGPGATPRRFPAVLIIHGFKGSSAQRHIAGISDELVEAGFLTVRPDLTCDPGRSYQPFADMTYGQELADCEDVLDFILKIDEVDSSKVGITGHSLGGMIAAEIASKRDEIRALATLSAVYDFKWIANKVFNKPFERAKKDFREKGFTTVWSSYLEKRLAIKEGFYEDAFFRSAAKFAKVIKCPTLIVSSGNDEAVSQSHADKYLKTIGSKNKEMEIIEGSDHNYSDEALRQVSKTVAHWFSETLRV